MAEIESVTPRPPLSPARGELAAAIELLAAARSEAEAAAVPSRRLTAVVAELDRAERELAKLRSVLIPKCSANGSRTVLKMRARSRRPRR
jgi:hypothetical protein